jgi:hypothetical protein
MLGVVNCLILEFTGIISKNGTKLTLFDIPNDLFS